MSNNRRTFILLQALMLIPIVALMVVSCKPTVPSEYIQPEEMEDILYDYHLSQAMAYQRTRGNLQIRESATPAYKRNEYYHSVLRKHGVTEAEFDSSLVYYYSHADRLHKIYKRISERMENNAISLGATVGDINKYSRFSADGDTANIWQGVTSTVLTPSPPYNRLDFNIEIDSTFRKGDSFLFNFMTDFIYQGGTKDAVIYMAVRYDNDSVSTHVNHVSVSGMSQLRVIENTENGIKDINGFIYLNRGNDESNTVKLMFINQIQLIRFHKQVNPASADSLTETPKIDSLNVVLRDTLSKTRVHIVDTVRRPVTNGIMKRTPLIHNNAEKIQKSGGK